MIKNTLTYLSALIGSKIKNERGQAMVEYGLLVALISIAAVATLLLIGPRLVSAFNTVLTSLGGTPPAP